MLLILSSRQRLLARYGLAGLADLERELDRFADGIEARGGARTLFPDDPLRMAPLGLEAVTVAAAADLRAALIAIRGALAARGEPASAILLIGGDSVVPFFRIPNPVRDRTADPDPEVLTDNPYGLESSAPATPTASALVSPRLPVGRIPDAEPPALEPFLRQLRRLAEPPPADRRRIFAVSDPAFGAGTRTVLAGRDAELRTSPGWHAGDPDWRRQRARLLYFNLHGFDDEPVWKGFANRSGRWQVALRPSHVTEEESSGAAVFAENCYGALVTGRSPARSIALSFLAAGARAFVGATGLAFASVAAPLTPVFLASGRDLGEAFLDQVLGGASFGRALVEARRIFVGAGPRTTFELKTALQVVLYGNPLSTL